MTAALRGMLSMLEDESLSVEARLRCAVLLLRPIVAEAEAGPRRPLTATERQREKRRRDGGRDGPVTPVTPVTASVTSRDASFGGGRGGDLGSDRQKEPSPPVSIPLREREESVTASVTSRDIVVTLTLPITDELRATASMTGVQDVDTAWLKFCGHYNGRPLDLAGRWQVWCAREAKTERTDRERGRARGPGPSRPENTGSPVQRTPDFELYPHELKRIADAQKGSR